MARTASGCSAPGSARVGKKSTSRRWPSGYIAGFRPRQPFGHGCSGGKPFGDGSSLYVHQAGASAAIVSLLWKRFYSLPTAAPLVIRRSAWEAELLLRRGQS